MEFISSIFNDLIVQPAVALLQYMHALFGSYGVAIIIFGILVKMVTLPLTLQQLRSSRAMQELQPKLKELQKLYKDDREKLAQEQMKMYREHGVNPLGGCLPLLIQMPVLIGLYRAIIHLANTDPDFQKSFLWIKNLAQPEGPPYILIILMVISQFLYQRLMTPPSADPQQESMQKAMQFMPIMFAILFINFPAGLVLYYLVFNVVSIAQQFAINKWTDLKGGPVLAPETDGTATEDKSVTKPVGKEKVQRKTHEKPQRRRRRRSGN